MMSETKWSPVRRDLAAFCDLGSELLVHEYPDHLEFDFERNGKRLEGQILRRDGELQVLPEYTTSRNPISYEDFLASDEMSNLRRLAQQTTLMERELKRKSKRELNSRRGSVVFYNCFVPQEISVAGAGTGSGVEVLEELVGEQSDAGTQIVFLAAQAGQGKSSLLDAFTIRRAQQYLRGDSSQLCLYVDAQGRGLARLDEAIARQLNDLQFMLSYSAVVSLVREGLLVLIVDGFDELIGSRGTYDDAFGSLSNFIETLEGRGTLVAATRSSYFTQEFGSRSSIFDSDDAFAYEMALAELQPWDKRAQREYFGKVILEAKLPTGPAKDATREFTHLQAADDANLLSRPLFARDMSLLVIDEWSFGSGDEIHSTPELVGVLASSYLEREVDSKLRTRDRRAILEAEQLGQYYAEIAGEMWSLETREIDGRSLKELMELLVEAWDLSAEGADILRARYTYLPFLSVDASGKTATFEHEVFFSYFFAKSAIVDLWAGKEGSAQALMSKAGLDATAADFLAADLLQAAGSLSSAIGRLCRIAAGRHPRQSQIQMNCGAVIGAMLRTASPVSARTSVRVELLQDVTLAAQDLSGLHVEFGELRNVDFSRCDFRGTVLTAASSSALRFRDLLVDPDTTRFDLGSDGATVDVQGVRVATEGGIQSEYEVARLTAVLRQVGLAAVDEVAPLYSVDPAAVSHVGAIAHAYEQVNPIGTAHTRVGHLLNPDDRVTRRAVKLLEECGLIEEVKKATSGRPQRFYKKRFASAKLMEGLWAPTGVSEIDEFWRLLSEEG